MNYENLRVCYLPVNMAHCISDGRNLYGIEGRSLYMQKQELIDALCRAGYVVIKKTGIIRAKPN